VVAQPDQAQCGDLVITHVPLEARFVRPFDEECLSHRTLRMSAAEILPHKPIQKLSENLWRVQGDLPHFGMQRVMTIAKRAAGDLVIHSAIQMNEASMREMEAFGEPTYLLIPHSRHRLDAPKFKRRYPKLIVLATKAVVDKAREVVHVDGTYEDFPSDAPEVNGVRLEMLRGMGDSEGVMIVRSQDGVTIVLNEVVFDLTMPHSRVLQALLKLGGLGPGPHVTPILKLELVRDRQALKADLHRLAKIPDVVRLIVSHDRMRSGIEAATSLDAAAASL
jgi:hypothetical protein